MSVIEATALCGLMSYGLTMLLRYTSGPFNVFFRLRVLAGMQYFPIYDDDENIVDIIEEEPEYKIGMNDSTGVIVFKKDSNFLASLFYCYWCLTTWVSFLLALLVCVLTGMWYFTPIVWLATIGISGFLHNYGSSK